MKVYVIQQIETVDDEETATVFNKVWTDKQKALQEVQEAAIELHEMFVDPNNPSPEDKFPGLDVDMTGDDWSITVKDEDLLSDHVKWFILERELV